MLTLQRGANIDWLVSSCEGWLGQHSLLPITMLVRTTAGRGRDWKQQQNESLLSLSNIVIKQEGRRGIGEDNRMIGVRVGKLTRQYLVRSLCRCWRVAACTVSRRTCDVVASTLASSPPTWHCARAASGLATWRHLRCRRRPWRRSRDSVWRSHWEQWRGEERKTSFFRSASLVEFLSEKFLYQLRQLQLWSCHHEVKT